MPSAEPVSDTSLLGAYARRGAFTDCYATSLPLPVTLADFIEAFYTTLPFKLERWVLAKAMGMPSSDEQAAQLAQSQSTTFSAWDVEDRTQHEIILAAWQTRSWLCVRPEVGAKPGTVLLFGSAVLPTRSDGRFGLPFHLLGGFHRQYSKILLVAAAKRVVKLRRQRVG